MNFGEAITWLKSGYLVCRRGWNGKNAFIWFKRPTIIKSEWCKDPILRAICDENGGEAEALGTICMKTADGKILTGWLASQTDILAEDWDIVQFSDICGDWDKIPNEEKAYPDEVENVVSNDKDFEHALDNVEALKASLHKNKENAIETFGEIKEMLKMTDMEKIRDSILNRKSSDTTVLLSNIQRDMLDIIDAKKTDGEKEDKEEKLQKILDLREKYLSKDNTKEQAEIIRENFDLFEEYVRNNEC